MFGTNNDESNSPQNIFSLLRNLLQKDQIQTTEETTEPREKVRSEEPKTEREIFIPYPHDDDDDNLKLF
jgi:hypothetical protein